MVSSADADRITRHLENAYGIRRHGEALHLAMLFATADPTTLAALRADSAVASVEPDVLTYLADEPAGLPSPVAAAGIATRADAIPWGVDRVGAPAAWAAGITGTGVKVGIIDSGIDPTHPDLSVAGGYDFTTASSASSAWADNVASCSGHGTHVAGTVAALRNGSGVVGVAPGAELYSLKVFEVINGGCAAWSSNQIAAIDWAVAHGLRVINLSIASSTALQAYQDAITTASNAGVLVVAAAGNNSGGPITYPAAYVNAVAVGATTSSDQVAYFSDLGPEMWVAAPGNSIVSTLPGGGTGTKSGTSMASPHVAGVAALLIQLHPTWSTAQVRDALRTGAQDLSSPGWDSGTGWGLVQAPSGGGGGTTPPTLALSPGSRSVIVAQGGTAPGDQATVTISGTNASTASWSATKRKSWTTITAGSGTGSGIVGWSRNPTGLALGTYVDTITVSVTGATGSPAHVIDTLVVSAAATPVTMAVSPGSRRATVVEGGAAEPDSATVAMSGTNAWAVGWSASAGHSWTMLATASGTGNGHVRWNRNAAGLSPGTYVDTITVTAQAGGSPARVIDTLVVAPAPTVVTLALSPTSRRVSIVEGGSAPSGQAAISLTGTGSASVSWSATHSASWVTLLSASGTGSSTLRWLRRANGFAAGVYVDTIRVSAPGAVGSPAVVIDSMVVTAPTISVSLAITPGSRSATAPLYGAAPGDSVAIVLTGADAATAEWSTSHSAGWIAIAASSGTGGGTLRWNRIVSGLSPGVHVDTITVTIPGAAGSPAYLVDTLTVTGLEPLALSVTPGSRRVEAVAGSSSNTDVASVVLTGNGSAATAWYASARHPWTTILTPSATGSGQLRWQRTPNGLAPGTYVDTITVTVAALSARVIDSLVVSSDGKGGTLVLSRGGTHRKQLRMDGQQTSVGSDSLVVQGIAGGPAVGSWTATTSANWIHLESWSGDFPGVLRWSRSTGGLAAGFHVDSIVVQLVADAGFRAVYVDSVEVVNVTSPAPAQAADALFRGSGLTADQLAILDAAGNKNGRYDLGDFLAWVERGNIQLNAAVRARLQRVAGLGSAIPDSVDTPRPPPH